MNEYQEKLRSISTPRKLGKKERIVERERSSTLVTTKHWDGRQDATVTPDPVRYGTRVHGEGKKKGQVAEVSEMSPKQSRERYGQTKEV